MEPVVTNTYPPVPAQRISWGAVFGGAVLSVGIWILLEVLGFAIGLSVAHPARGLRGISIGAGIWTLVAPLVALFVGGIVAGRLAGLVDRFGGALHGGVMWALTMMFGVLLLGSLGRMLMNGVPPAAAGTVDQLRVNAAAVASQTGHALFWVFGALLLALICSVLGATAGVSRRQVAALERPVYATATPEPAVVSPPPERRP